MWTIDLIPVLLALFSLHQCLPSGVLVSIEVQYVKFSGCTQGVQLKLPQSAVGQASTVLTVLLCVLYTVDIIVRNTTLVAFKILLSLCLEYPLHFIPVSHSACRTNWGAIQRGRESRLEAWPFMKRK